MVNLALQFSDAFKSGNIDKGTVPGAITLIKGVSYWRPDISLMDKAIEKVLYGFNAKEKIVANVKTVDKEASLDKRRKLSIKEVSRITEQVEIIKEAPAALPGLIIEVLNGFGKPKAAQVAARFLKSKGIQVPKYSNAGTFSYTDTLIVDWKGNVESSLSLAQIMKIDPSKIIVYDKPDKPIDFTIVLGADWETLKNELL